MNGQSLDTVSSVSRRIWSARREYDATVAGTLRHGDLESRRRLAEVIDELYELGGELPERIHENRRLLAAQIARARGPAP